MNKTTKAADEVRSTESGVEAKKNRSMGIGPIGSMGSHTATFVKKFRWALKTKKLPEHFMKEVKINFSKKTVTFHCYEVLLSNEDSKDIEIQEWLDMPDHNDEMLVFTTYDGCGETLYEMKFGEIEVVNDESHFDYASSEASVREVTVSWETYERHVPSKGIVSRWPR